MNGNNIDIYEDGQESRDFVFIDDVIDATILALENNKVNNEVFNVGSGVGTSIKVVAKLLKEKYNGNIELVVSGKFRIGDIRHNIADLTKVNAVLGYKPQIDFKSGISKFVDWVKTQKVQSEICVLSQRQKVKKCSEEYTFHMVHRKSMNFLMLESICLPVVFLDSQGIIWKP